MSNSYGITGAALVGTDEALVGMDEGLPAWATARDGEAPAARFRNNTPCVARQQQLLTVRVVIRGWQGSVTLRVRAFFYFSGAPVAMSWACDRCTLEQSDSRRTCAACGNLRPDLLRACLTDVKRQKRPRPPTTRIVKGGAAKPRGVWSVPLLASGMVPPPRRVRSAVANLEPLPQLQVPLPPSPRPWG